MIHQHVVIQKWLLISDHQSKIWAKRSWRLAVTSPITSKRKISTVRRMISALFRFVYFSRARICSRSFLLGVVTRDVGCWTGKVHLSDLRIGGVGKGLMPGVLSIGVPPRRPFRARSGGAGSSFRKTLPRSSSASVPLSQDEGEIEAEGPSSRGLIELAFCPGPTKLALRRWYGCGDRERLRSSKPPSFEDVLACGMALSVGCTEFIWYFECCSEKLKTPHHLSFLSRQVASKVDLDAFLNALGMTGATCVMRFGIVGMWKGQMACATSLLGNHGYTCLDHQAPGETIVPAKAQPAYSPFSSPFNG
jgi:hypothetical protein